MKFIDLFAGLGGFHVALNRLGHECVFACEKEKSLQDLYQENFGITCHGDIRKVDVEDIPSHDILTAGFPCQPFSKAGKQKGLEDENRGDLIYDILKILEYHQPKYFILENVPNLKRHDREKTWFFMQEQFKLLGYSVKEDILSPHFFGIPQIRNRIFIVGQLGDNCLINFKFPQKQHNENLDIRSILDEYPIEAKPISEKQIECINLWQEIINLVPQTDKLPGFPIWGMEFRANYPIDGISPFHMSEKELSKYRGAFGKSLMGLSKQEQIDNLPRYAQYDEEAFPSWKQKYINDIRSFLKKYDKEFMPLFLKLERYPPSWQKFEWNCGDNPRNIFDYLIQFRASGIRVKKTNYSPALVLTSTQIPIIGWEKRYITLKEGAKLQNLESIKLPLTNSQSYRALGNAVNVKIVELVANKLTKSR